MTMTLEDSIKLILTLTSIMFITHAIVFMTLSYCMTGDMFLALKNFYNLVYNMGI